MITKIKYWTWVDSHYKVLKSQAEKDRKDWYRLFPTKMEDESKKLLKKYLHLSLSLDEQLLWEKYEITKYGCGHKIK